MTELRTLPELENALLQYGQALAFADIDQAEYDRAAADINAQIAAIKLKNAKNDMAKPIDSRFKAGKMDRITYHRAITQIADCKTLEQLENLKNAA